MQPSHIEHIGIAVTSLDESIPFFETLLGTKCYAIEEVADQKVKTAFLRLSCAAARPKSSFWNPPAPKAPLPSSLRTTMVVVACTTSLSPWKTSKLTSKRLRNWVSVSSTRPRAAAPKA